MAGNFDNQAGPGGHLGNRPKWARDALIRRLYARGDISQVALGKQFGCSSIGRALDCESSRCGFEPHRSTQQ